MQQLLLLTLVALLVGIALLVGLNTSKETMHQANEYGVALQALSIVGYAQAWRLKPAEMGGGNGSFLNLSFVAMTRDSVNINGRFELSEIQAESFRLSGVGVEGSPLHVTLLVYADSISGLTITR